MDINVVEFRDGTYDHMEICTIWRNKNILNADEKYACIKKMSDRFGVLKVMERWPLITGYSKTKNENHI